MMKRVKPILILMLTIILGVGASSASMALSPVNHDSTVPNLQMGVIGSTRLLVVSSGSMCQRLGNPSIDKCTLAIGDLIVIASQDPSRIVAGPAPIGSIIAFRPFSSVPDYLVVHRVITEHQNSSGYFFETRGDANAANDPWDYHGGVPASSIVGVYQYTVPIAYLGLLILTIQNFISRLQHLAPR